MMYDVETTLPKPKWYQFRNILSNIFLWLAKKTYNENPEIFAFMLKAHTDMMITGKAITHIDLEKFYKMKGEALAEQDQT